MRALFLLLMALSLISINVNRLRDGNKRTGLLQFLRCLSSCHDFLVRLVSHLKGRVYGGRSHRVDPYQEGSRGA